MKTLFVSLAALAAVSSVALASDRSDQRDSSGTYFGKHASQNKAKNSNALIIVKKGNANLTAFERMKLIMEENEHGGNDNGAGHSNGGAL